MSDFVRHRWYKYKESFDPTIVLKAIKETGITSNDFLLDPFNGSGTVTLTASSLGLNSIGVEVNPFAAFLAKTKNLNPRLNEFNNLKDAVLLGAEKTLLSPLLNYSTFSKGKGKSKWLFNRQILNSFEGGWDKTKASRSMAKDAIRLALIGASMDNCNAVRDGKCLKYKDDWQETNYKKGDFLNDLENRLNIIEEDLKHNNIKVKSNIINGDSRTVLNSKQLNKFKLCITSPPYLNSFDYTDLYRPELFLGKFINSGDELQKLRFSTIRSHVEIKLTLPVIDDFGLLYKQVITKIKGKELELWDKQIPIMIQAYFEDIFNVLRLLKKNATEDAQLWIVVSNSAYAGVEIPVDLIIGDIGSKVGWYLKEIEVVQYLKKRVTKYSPDITELRESVIKFSIKKP